ncbi:MULTISPECIES: hypothetical protein [unclassified Mesorhizobium]|uniref:hypothetical protein n=1 Tax=unclassified Mesorhizobium TaxID=325217 RepID=UPI000F74CB40|nr:MULTISPECIES: hypothetical protein [unclassified Mesorhizobium]AZO04102.1 hypothetical protein EJ068_14310 [Mesorhizobium sp. M2A.F.Ca.ET.043.02.1.1]RUW33834.1 hypothetical protein EOA37_30325 [Mesorhizobium sp. M2A.F.Ca.ET.015.02.1.1]RUW78839.1 hypothetical protein EOA28_09835 [Mesorhizobium sp. M2A.F.Ca.ET.067.02.1.1]RVC93796.1 hypothetical protein EN739_19820 [Mesorhizobium sp. M2A.F.Ca.ET.017.03.2.1]RVD07556.1 hypothetical protein EN753_17490 [Mesorhizobium sp. M2A.F.Ca.ET.029.05.1.1]
MAETVEPIDLFELVMTGRAGPVELGKSSRETVRGLIDPEDVRADNHYRHEDTESAWCIYGRNCEFFFSPDFRLRSISVEPVFGRLQPGGMMATWYGDLNVDVGRHPVTFAGTSPIAIHTLPKALQFLNEGDFKWAIGGGSERDVYIKLAESSRVLTLKYEVNAIPVGGKNSVAFEIDYFLSTIVILDQAVQGG